MRDPRTVHVKVVCGRFVSVLPPAGHSPDCKKHFSPENRITAQATTRPSTFKTEDSKETRAIPTLLAPRKMIDLALHDAKLCRQSEPTEDALIARNWIEHKIGRPDKNLYQHNPAYRSAYKDAYYLSFEWCCEWLEIKDCEAYRSDLIHQVEDAIAKHLYKVRKPSIEARMRELIGWEMAKDFSIPREGFQMEMFQ
jgi:hypothetical protein